MKTVSSLYQRLRSHLEEIPAVDVHTHVQYSRQVVKTHAAGLDDLVFYHYLVTEMQAAGMPAQFLAGFPTAEERLEACLPYLRRIENTTAYWGLMRLLKDLYGFSEPRLTKDNWRDLHIRVQELSRDPQRYRAVQQQANIGTTFVTVEYWEQPRDDDHPFVYTLRFDNLLEAAARSRERLAQTSGVWISDAASLKSALDLILKRFAQSGGVALTGSFAPGQGLEPVSPAEVDRLLARSKQELDADERGLLLSFGLHHVLAQAEDLGLAVQLLLGVRRPMPGDKAVAGFEADTIAQWCHVFHRYSRLRFDVFLGSAVLVQDLITAAKNYPNVYVGCNWWYHLTPTHLRRTLREQLEHLPASKVVGFFSDAYVMEWSCPKLALVRNETARVLADMVVEGYLSEETAVEAAHRLLRDNAAALMAPTGNRSQTR